jgi:hypothetical protein
MAQFREYFTRVFITGTEITITTTYGAIQINDIVLRDGSMDTNFKAKQAAHRDVILGLEPSSTSAPCYLDLTGHWIKQTNSGTIISANATVTVPTGNSGVLVLYTDTAYTVKYSKNGGAFTTIVDGGTVTVANGDTLKFEALSVAAFDYVTGDVYDQDTGRLVDSISLLNNTP